MKKAIRVLTVDDTQIIHEGLKSLISLEDDIEIIGQSTDSTEVLSQVETLSPDIVLMDIKMPGVDGIELTRRISRKSLASKVIMLTMYDQYLSQAMDVGARGYLLKSIRREKLAQAIRTVNKGGVVIDENITSQSKLDSEKGKQDMINKSCCPMVEEIRLAMLPPVDIKQVTRFAERTEHILRLRMAQLFGSRDQGIILTFIFRKPVDLVDIKNNLDKIPEVKSITDEFCPIVNTHGIDRSQIRERPSSTLIVRFEKDNLDTISQRHTAIEKASSLFRGIVSHALK